MLKVTKTAVRSHGERQSKLCVSLIYEWPTSQNLVQLKRSRNVPEFQKVGEEAGNDDADAVAVLEWMKRIRNAWQRGAASVGVSIRDIFGRLLAFSDFPLLQG